MKRRTCRGHGSELAATIVFLLIGVVSLLHLKVQGQDVASLTANPDDSPKATASFEVSGEPSEDGYVSTEPPGVSASVATAVDRSEEPDTGLVASHSKMFIDDPVVMEIMNAEEYSVVLEAATQTNKAVIMMLYSAWCPHCFSFKNTFSNLADDLQDRFHFAALNCVESDELLATCTRIGVFSLPSIRLFVPASIHRQLPDSYQHAKQFGTPAADLFFELIESKEGGLLNSFDEATLAIHTLALPGDVYTAVQYAALRTLQHIPKSHLQKTLGKFHSALEALKGKPCDIVRWQAEEISSSSTGLRKQGDSETTSVTVDALANARVHDAIRGLQLILASWVVTLSDTLSRDEEFAMIDFLEAVRATIPLRSVKKSAALAILHLYKSTGTAATVQKPHVTTTNAQFAEVIDLYNEVDEELKETKGLATSAWRKWIGSIPFGKEAPALPPLQEPELKHCKTQTCGVWMLLHLISEGAAELAKMVTEHPRCGPAEVFYKRKSQALPIYLLKEQQKSGKELDMNRVLAVSSMDTSALIDHNPSLGCMIVPSFDVAYSFYNVLRRFFACAECRHHFQIQFARRTHGLIELQPPEGVYTLSTPSMVDDTDDHSLLEKFRSQDDGSYEAWSGRRVEADKLDRLRIWLWRLHNAVNVRTAADTTLDFVKGHREARNYANCDVRWPSRSLCPECRTGTTPASGFVSTTLLEQRNADKDIFAIEEEISDFDQKAVMNFLRTSFWPEAFQKK